MRKMIIMLSIAVCGWVVLLPQLQAQDYLPIVKENAEWSVLFTQSGNNGQIYTTRHYSPAGDTLIQDKTFTKLYSNTGKEFNLDSAQYVGAYINEGNKILYVEKDSFNPKILYDFDIPIGWISATFSNCDTSQIGCMFYELVSKDTMLYADNIPRLRYNFDWVRNEGNGIISRRYAYSWIEGIGSTLGFFPDPNLLFLQYLPTDPVFFIHLLCYKVNDNLVYNHPTLYKGKCYIDNITNLDKIDLLHDFKIYPNPITTILTVENKNYKYNDKTLSLTVFNSIGHNIFETTLDSSITTINVSSLPAGIYFIYLRTLQGEFIQKSKIIIIN